MVEVERHRPSGGLGAADEVRREALEVHGRCHPSSHGHAGGDALELEGLEDPARGREVEDRERRDRVAARAGVSQQRRERDEHREILET